MRGKARATGTRVNVTKPTAKEGSWLKGAILASLGSLSIACPLGNCLASAKRYPGCPHSQHCLGRTNSEVT